MGIRPNLRLLPITDLYIGHGVKFGEVRLRLTQWFISEVILTTMIYGDN